MTGLRFWGPCRMLLCVAGMVALLTVTSATASDTEPLPGSFGDSGVYTPEDSSVERTYKIPDIDAGFMYDNASYRVRPNFGLELDERTIFGWEIKTDALVGEDVIGVAPMWKVTSIIETSVGPGLIYDTREQEYGVAVTVMMSEF